MTINNASTVRYFSFFSFHSYGYEKKKELRPDYQAVILAYQPNS